MRRWSVGQISNATFAASPSVALYVYTL